MLCETCQKENATVHFTVVGGSSGELTTQNLCENCYGIYESERAKSYNTEPISSFPTDVENITATEYLEAAEKAERNGVDKPALSYVTEQLQQKPSAQQRLAREMMPIVWSCLEQGTAPPTAAESIVCLWGGRDAQELPDFTAWLEKCILRSFDLQNGNHSRFVMTLFTMLSTLSRIDRPRFTTMIATLRNRDGRSGYGRRWIIDEVEKAVLKPPGRGSDIKSET